MPNSYNPSGVNLGEARLIKLQSMVVAKLSDLNTQLALDSYTSALGPVQSTQVIIGDVEREWEPSDSSWGANPAYMLIAVSAGGQREGLDFTSKIEYVDFSMKRFDLYTSIFVYFHPQCPAFQLTDFIAQSKAREISRERVADWLRGDVFNPRDGSAGQIALASTEMDNTADQLTRCMITQGYKGYFSRGFAGDEVFYGIHFMHYATIA